eukprot:GHVT01081177.1.p1 GENE.GHVT01081177.1~~GHVT01081177.1.p1  ORF type:complete len:201 (+),score=33.32 GHVT01081177.1:86-688(+)
MSSGAMATGSSGMSGVSCGGAEDHVPSLANAPFASSSSSSFAPLAGPPPVSPIGFQHFRLMSSWCLNSLPSALPPIAAGLTLWWGTRAVRRIHALLERRYADIPYQLRRPDALANRIVAFKYLVGGSLLVPAGCAALLLLRAGAVERAWRAPGDPKGGARGLAAQVGGRLPATRKAQGYRAGGGRQRRADRAAVRKFAWY